MRFYAIRHARSMGNEDASLQGEHNSLAPAGRIQADLLAHRLKQFPIKRVISSETLRAKETAEIISAELGIPFVSCGLFNERRRATEEIGIPKEDPKVRVLWELMQTNYGKPGWRYSDEETHDEISNRILDSLSYLEDLGDGTCVIVHSGYLRILLASVICGGRASPDLVLNLRKNVRVYNTGICTFELGSDFFSPNPSWRSLAWNDTAHLAGTDLEVPQRKR